MNDTNSTPPVDQTPTPAATTSPALPPSPVHVVLDTRPAAGRRLLALVGWIGFLVAVAMLLSQRSARRDYFDTTEGIRERYHSGAENGRDKVAIIALRGVIVEGDGFVKRQIDRVRKDERVKAVVLRVDSPGGTVTGSDYIYHHLRRLTQERNIPLVVSMGSIAASGGYYVSMAVGDQPGSIYAEPTTTTGSIGVIVPHYDISGLLARFDVVDDSIASHPRKQLLSMTRTMSPEDRAIIRQYVDDSFGRFKDLVKAGRPALRDANPDDKLLAPQTKRDLATGEIFPAQRALEYGLIDRIGFIEDAIARAIELAGLDEDLTRVVQYDRPMSLMSLAGMAQAAEDDTGFTALLELSAPRAYYLATSLPPLVSTRREN